MINKARELGKLIQQSEEYKNMMDAKTNFETDEELQKLVGEFNLKKIDLGNKINAEQKDNDKIAELDKELRALYKSIMENPQMEIYNITKKAVDDILTQINTIIYMSANGEDPDDIDISHNCGGNCSSCGGCH